MPPEILTELRSNVQMDIYIKRRCTTVSEGMLMSTVGNPLGNRVTIKKKTSLSMVAYQWECRVANSQRSRDGVGMNRSGRG